MKVATSVFISYAAGDPDWPAEVVQGFGRALLDQGAQVLLDQFHQERIGRRLSIDEWRRWMRQWVAEADHIVCLASPRYLKAANRDVEDPSGYGVAFESLRLIHGLYENKGHNDGRILVARPDAMAVKTCVPEDLRFDCPQYEWQTDRNLLTADAVRPTAGLSVEPVRMGGATAVAVPPVDESASPGGDPYGAGPVWADGAFARRQESFTVEHLQAAPSFFGALRADLRAKFSHFPWVSAAPEQFVTGLARADKKMAHETMFAVRRVLKKIAPTSSQTIDEPTRQAAVSVYLSCACRWTRADALNGLAGRVLRVPPMLVNPIAVLSATLFGGSLTLRTGDAGGPVAAHTYEINHAPGEDASTNLLRALYCALCANDFATLDTARRDSTTADEVQAMVSAIRVQLDDIANVEQSSFTLIVDCPDVFDGAAWAADLELRAFARDSTLVEELFVIAPRDLDNEIRKLWQSLRKDESPPASTPAAKAAPATPPKESTMVQPPPSFQIHAQNVSLTMGDHSPSTTTVTQQVHGLQFADLASLIAELRAEIQSVPAGRLRNSLDAQVADIEQAVQTSPADAKARITQGLKQIKLVADAADGTDKLISLVTKVAAVAAPILGVIF
jgi:hypothetical protein